ncbi:hypothetical protein FB451DRAFT_1180928 [Mycena latifolia]|nr:hypothetical protein FB451DRAFT_1180928 [Mycena latifolia]
MPNARARTPAQTNAGDYCCGREFRDPNQFSPPDCATPRAHLKPACLTWLVRTTWQLTWKVERFRAQSLYLALVVFVGGIALATPAGCARLAACSNRTRHRVAEQRASRTHTAAFESCARPKMQGGLTSWARHALPTRAYVGVPARAACGAMCGGVAGRGRVARADLSRGEPRARMPGLRGIAAGWEGWNEADGSGGLVGRSIE